VRDLLRRQAMRPWLVPLALVLALQLVACGPKSYPASAAALQDADLAARIKSVLLNNRAIDATKVDVRVERGAVTLEGMVFSEADARTATELVRAIPGVSGVESKVEVGRPANPVSRRPRPTTVPS
jgi:hypothetical protein